MKNIKPLNISISDELDKYNKKLDELKEAMFLLSGVGSSMLNDEQYKNNTNSMNKNSEVIFFKDEQKRILKKCKFPEGLIIRQSLNVLLWTLINKRKFFKFVEKLSYGMSIRFAYIDAKEYKRIK
jgi:hypothetical protein